jgi:hypothetical protein
VISQETQRDSNWNWKPWVLWMLLRKIVFRSIIYLKIFFCSFATNVHITMHIQIAVLIASVATYSEIHAGNSEEENKGYVVFKK